MTSKNNAFRLTDESFGADVIANFRVKISPDANGFRTISYSLFESAPPSSYFDQYQYTDNTSYLTVANQVARGFVGFGEAQEFRRVPGTQY
jgi:hypothetical protein